MNKNFFLENLNSFVKIFNHRNLIKKLILFKKILFQILIIF
jgi:hypothetical protein